MKHTQKASRARPLQIDFVRFCIVGSSGFVLNFTLLSLLYKFAGLPIFLAQLISAEIALFSNFLLHNNWTYKLKMVNKPLPDLLWQFHVVSWVAIVGSALIVGATVKYLHFNYALALIISSATALFWNFLWTKFVVWKHHHPRLTVKVAPEREAF